MPVIKNFNFFKTGYFYTTGTQHFECCGVNVLSEPPVFDSVVECCKWFQDRDLDELVTRLGGFSVYGYAIDEYGDPNFEEVLRYDITFSKNEIGLYNSLRFEQYKPKKSLYQQDKDL